jgi:hypothetical protein
LFSATFFQKLLNTLTLTYYQTNNSNFTQNIQFRNFLLSSWSKVLINFKKLNTYYIRNEHLWLDGFLFDFLQKKTADIWVRKFVIYTGFLFSERLVFDTIIKLYIDYFVWYTHKFSIFEVSNVFEMLTTVLYLAVTLFFTLTLIIVIF